MGATENAGSIHYLEEEEGGGGRKRESPIPVEAISC